jgi:hypothetical protein
MTSLTEQISGIDLNRQRSSDCTYSNMEGSGNNLSPLANFAAEVVTKLELVCSSIGPRVVDYIVMRVNPETKSKLAEKEWFKWSQKNPDYISNTVYVAANLYNFTQSWKVYSLGFTAGFSSAFALGKGTKIELDSPLGSEDNSPDTAVRERKGSDLSSGSNDVRTMAKKAGSLLEESGFWSYLHFESLAHGPVIPSTKENGYFGTCVQASLAGLNVIGGSGSLDNAGWALASGAFAGNAAANIVKGRGSENLQFVDDKLNFAVSFLGSSIDNVVNGFLTKKESKSTGTGQE